MALVKFVKFKTIGRKGYFELTLVYREFEIDQREKHTEEPFAAFVPFSFVTVLLSVWGSDFRVQPTEFIADLNASLADSHHLNFFVSDASSKYLAGENSSAN